MRQTESRHELTKHVDIIGSHEQAAECFVATHQQLLVSECECVYFLVMQSEDLWRIKFIDNRKRFLERNLVVSSNNFLDALLAVVIVSEYLCSECSLSLQLFLVTRKKKVCDILSLFGLEPKQHGVCWIYIILAVVAIVELCEAIIGSLDNLSRGSEIVDRTEITARSIALSDLIDVFTNEKVAVE